ncbi:MAG: hypothetical protein JXA14_22930 [Anaerolineae bacterium]|nr:hypothetical protein [Anaerolineae bacterium]
MMGADGWAAYQLDLACMIFGTWVENKLEEHDKKGKPKHTLADLLREPAAGGGRQRPTPKPASVFMNPMLAGMAVKTVKPNPDGTW